MDKSMITGYLWMSAIFLFMISTSATIDEKSNGDPMEYYILEELPANTLIGNVIIDAGLNTKYNKLTTKLLRFSFLNQMESKQDLFAIQSDSGIIRTTRRIDRDDICPHQNTCHMWLHVAVHPPQYFEVIKILVNILDVNDHRPTFPGKYLDLTVIESAPIGTTFALPTASDPDSATFSIEGYELHSSTDKFHLEVSKNSFDGSTDLELKLVKKLDREKEDFYKMKVVAHDGGTPSKSGSIIINITVEDTNDNHPRFTNISYEVFVAENIPIGTTVTKVTALDNDHGINGQIVYRFSQKTESTSGNLFDIDNHTGEILVKGELDYESGSIYLLTIIGEDEGINSQPGQATVVVRVEDMNDNPPQITLNTLTTTGAAEVAENAAVATFVAHVSVADIDSGINGEVDCRLNHDDFSIERIYNDQYKIITKSILDRELRSSYNLMILCSDKGTQSNSASHAIQVNVMDENDNVPSFLHDVYYPEIKENNYVDDFITKVSATDEDQEENGEVRYKIHAEAGGLFNVHPLTGVITTNAIFDHEQLQQLAFRVLAYDLGTPSQTGTATVRLHILNTNDEAPKFPQYNYAFGTFENQPRGTEVGTVAAYDADDDGLNTHLLYAFSNPSQHVIERFAINDTSGKIFTKVVLDREDRSAYHMVVMATSKGFPQMSSSVSVTVYVADKNDNAPVIIYPKEHKSTVNISSVLPVGYRIATVKAKDSDAGPNAKLIYEIIRGNSKEFFAIDEDSGEVTISKPLYKIDKESNDLLIKVRDDGFPSRSSITKLTVKVSRSKSLKSSRSATKEETQNKNMVTVVTLSTVSLILIFVLIATILVIWRRGKRRNVVDKFTPDNRLESQQMLGDIANQNNKITNNLEESCAKHKDETQLSDLCETETTISLLEDSSPGEEFSIKNGAFVINLSHKDNVHMAHNPDVTKKPNRHTDEALQPPGLGETEMQLDTTQLQDLRCFTQRHINT